MGVGIPEMAYRNSMDKINKAQDYEKKFSYGKGLLPTPSNWISNFWDTHRNKVVDHLQPFVNIAESILFIGVGTGDVIPLLQTRGKKIVGIDLNKDFLSLAAQYCETIEGDGSVLPFENNSFDLIICNMVLHHIVGQGNLEKTFTEASRVLINGGVFTAFEPNVFHPSGFAMTMLNKFHLYHLVGGGSDYEYALSPFTLAKMCRQNFRQVRVKTLTCSHPRLPIPAQKILFRLDKHLSRFYPLSFSFVLEAIK